MQPALIDPSTVVAESPATMPTMPTLDRRKMIMQRSKKEWQSDRLMHRVRQGSDSSEEKEQQTPLGRRGDLSRSRSDDGQYVPTSCAPSERRGNLTRSRSSDGDVLMCGDATSRARLLLASKSWESFSTRSTRNLSMDKPTPIVEEEPSSLVRTSSRPSLMSSGAKSWESFRGSEASSRARMLLMSKGSESLRSLHMERSQSNFVLDDFSDDDSVLTIEEDTECEDTERSDDIVCCA